MTRRSATAHHAVAARPGVGVVVQFVFPDKAGERGPDDPLRVRHVPAIQDVELQEDACHLMGIGRSTASAI